MLPKVIAEQRDHCYLPTLGYQKTAKLQLPPPNSLLPYNSYYIIYIQFPVRSGFVVGHSQKYKIQTDEKHCVPIQLASFL